MKHLHTRISLYRPVLFIIWGPGPFKWLNLDQKRWTREEKSWSPLLISGFWQYNIAYDISFCCKLYHLSEWMQEKVIRGHWGDLWALIFLKKSPKMVKKQQYFMIYSIRILSSLSIIKWPKSLYGTSFMKPLYTINASTVYYWGFKAP